MSENSRTRRVVGSRNPTGRPRRLAGRQSTPVVEQVATGSTGSTGSTGEVVETPEGETGPVTAPPSRLLGGSRTTVALLGVVVVLLLVATAEVVYLVRDHTPTVSTARPVVTGELTHRAAVEAAARSTEQILSTTYEDYDEQVEQATSKMTDAFAQTYRQTSEGIRDRFLANKTRLQVKAVAQGVVQASPEQVQALLFLDQYVQKEVDGQPKTDYAQYRALVTVVHTDQGWLVSNIETQ